MKRHSAIAFSAVFAALLMTAPAASADTRYAKSTGSGSWPCLVESTPCPISTAVALSGPGDKVVIKPGPDFTSGGSFPLTAANLEIVGEGSPKPVLRFNVPAAIPGAGGLAYQSGATGNTVRNLRIEVTGGGPALWSNAANLTISDVEVSAAAGTLSSVVASGGGTTIDRLVTSGDGALVLNTVGFPPPGVVAVRRSRLGGSPNALITGVNSLVSDTLAQSTGSAAIAISAAGGKLRNVTAIASGTNAIGLHVGGGTPPPSVSVKNSIFRADGALADVVVTPQIPPILPPSSCIPPVPGCFSIPGGDLTITHSNFRVVNGTLNPASGSNSATDPQFGAGYRPLAGSPLIDAGVDDPDNGTTDLDGKARKIGSAVDIGAFEFEPPAPTLTDPPVTPSGGSENTQQQPQVVAPIADSTSPAVSQLGITNKVFAVGPGATPVAARAKKGTTFVYTLSEPAVVAVAIQRPMAGRRKGRSCVAATRKNRKAKKCTRYVAVGAVSGGTGVAGANALPFSGRIGRKALKPGTYRASLVAVDAAGNKSAAKTVGFKVVKR